MAKYSLVLPRSCLSDDAILTIAKMRNAMYIGDSEVPVRPTPEGKEPDWSSHPVAMFWQEQAPAGYANIFCAYRKVDGKLYICGPNGFDAIVDAVYTVRKPYYVSYSAYWHDYHAVDPTGNIAVDGGRLYTRTVGDPETYEVGRLNLVTKELFDSDGHLISVCKVRGRKNEADHRTVW